MQSNPVKNYFLSPTNIPESIFSSLQTSQCWAGIVLLAQHQINNEVFLPEFGIENLIDAGVKELMTQKEHLDNILGPRLLTNFHVKIHVD